MHAQVVMDEDIVAQTHSRGQGLATWEGGSWDPCRAHPLVLPSQSPSFPRVSLVLSDRPYPAPSPGPGFALFPA